MMTCIGSSSVPLCEAPEAVDIANGAEELVKFLAPNVLPWAVGYTSGARQNVFVDINAYWNECVSVCLYVCMFVCLCVSE